MRLLALFFALVFAASAAAQTSANMNARNRTGWEPVRNNVDTAAVVSLAGAGAGTTNSSDQVNYSGRGAVVVVDMTADGGSPSVVVTIQGKDVASGEYYTLLASAAITTTSVVVLQIYPDIAAAANLAAARPLPRTWRVSVAVAGTSPLVTLTVGASMIQ
jgi:hypothetical protein